jgi:hypothetical protein
MSGLNKLGFLALVASGLGRVRGRTWLILASIGIFIVGLLLWAGVATMSWLWTQAPAATEAGKRMAGEAATRIEQAVPGLKEQAEKWLPGLGAQVPMSDVSGSDVGPVPRFPGLVRSHFVREEPTVEAAYAGRAAFDAVLAHYVTGFAAAGYAQQVISATPEGEQHRFARGQEAIDLSLTRRRGDLLELRLKQTSRQ